MDARQWGEKIEVVNTGKRGVVGGSRVNRKGKGQKVLSDDLQSGQSQGQVFSEKLSFQSRERQILSWMEQTKAKNRESRNY